MRRVIDHVSGRRRDYHTVFTTEEGRRVLRDLNRFCMYVAPTADANEAVFAMGMQRVFRRIASLAGVSDEALLSEFQLEQETDHD